MKKFETTTPKTDLEPLDDTTSPKATQQPESSPSMVPHKKGDLDFVSDAKAAFLENRSPYASLLLFLVVGIISGAFYWASTSEVNEITRGQGKVVPTEYLQVVQSLEGGILADLKVAEGNFVTQGDSLLRIDTTAFEAEKRESGAQRDNLMAMIARLDAEAADRDAIEFPSHILESRPDLASTERRLFESRRSNLAASVQHLTRSLELKQRELDITLPLAEKGIVSQVEMLRLQSLVNDIESDLNRIRSESTREALEQGNDAKGKIEGIEQHILALEDKIRRADVRSPVTGTINKVNFNTIGGVIRSGEPIVEIVPHQSDLIVEANILPADIGFLHPGQKATVKLTAYDFSIYGGLEATVEQISADSFTDERGNSYYTVRLRTGDRTLKTSGQQFAVIPGMQAEVNILTGKKSVLDYLLKPLMRAKMNALTER